MLNYIKSELYRTFHRKYTYFAIGGGALLLFACNALLFLMEKNDILHFRETSGFLFITALLGPVIFLSIYYCTSLLNDCVFSDEFKSQTLKNTVSYGFTRTRIFFGKYFAALLVAFIALIVMLGAFLLGALLFYGAGAGAELQSGLALFGMQILASFPIWLAGLTLACALTFTTNGAATQLLFFGVTLALPMIATQTLPHIWEDSVKVLPYLLYNQIQSISKLTQWADLVNFWLVGLGYVLLALGAGWLLFSRREIK